ncbi:MAG: lysophospholipid acyltransferase family protein [Candidatus Symbiothrix sp.]|jgi:KDO2-lipid IV(A) lauroyltransferase|nr:lysophospholipid acyltransferase family protein [Candidatus Symbiothrix sp.]
MNYKQHYHRIRRVVKYSILVFFVRLFITTLRFFPRIWVEKVFGFFASIAFYVVAKERRRTIATLSLIYGTSHSRREIQAMGREVFVNQAYNFADYICTLHWKTRQQFEAMIDFVGEENLRREYDKGQGVISLMMHTGSWELSAIMPPVMGYETTAVSKALSNPRLNDLIVAARESRGMKNISRGKSYDKLVECIRKGECMIIMIDQDTKVKGVFVDFFGRKAYTPDGAARLALETHAPVVPMYMQRIAGHRHRFTILPAIPLVETGDRDHDLLVNTQNYTRQIENIIREIPSQWVWMHRRWKTTPDDVERYLEAKKKKLTST